MGDGPALGGVEGMSQANPFRSYLDDTRRPIYSALLVLPFFLFYHGGLFLTQSKFINGADFLILRFLAWFSIQTIFASALVLIAGFVIWQWKVGAGWTVVPARLVVMFMESLLFALLLYLTMGKLCRIGGGEAGASGTGNGDLWRLMENLVLYCGAGIYEELVFRVLLIGLLILVFTRLFRKERFPAAVLAIVLGALLFSLFHFVGEGGDEFKWRPFFQRAFAGVYFAALFFLRGFGVAAATHALYDILIGLRGYFYSG